ncbi:hypothetical protein [Belnapia moabensis]|uniref:hypothetical protein n=1 Tax=Belnapia moabensis TaxID=365533 RepID=UPI0012ED0211|nr:hypothetical protein [Belnapia moabensis]
MAERYEHLVRFSIPLRKRMAEFKWQPERPLEHLLQQLEIRGINVVADNVLSQEDSYSQPRFGLTVLCSGRPPLAYINLLKHNNSSCNELDAATLFDTVAHEAVHATAVALGRHEELPEKQDSDEYFLEEVCAHIGAGEINQRLGFPLQAQRNRFEANMFQLSLAQKTAFNVACARGIDAANYLVPR